MHNSVLVDQVPKAVPPKPTDAAGRPVAQMDPKMGDSSWAQQRPKSRVALPSKIIKAGPSKFGDWKKRLVAPSKGLVSASASKLMECTCDPCDCSPPSADICTCEPCECSPPPTDDCTCEPCECSPPPADICTCDPCECSPPPTDICTCNPCECTTPDSAEGEGDVTPAPEPEPNYNLTNFMRAREFFMTKSTKTGISLYDHFGELIRQLLDNKAPDNPVDFVEEISLNLKRYRFGMGKDVMQDSYYLSTTVIQDAEGKISTWKQHALWSAKNASEEESSGSTTNFGGFPNHLRLQYYLEQVDIGLPREEMFNVALVQRQIKMNNPVTRVRFWGKIFGINGNYYIFEAETPPGQELDNVWNASVPETPSKGNKSKFEPEDASADVPGPVDTLERAGKAVTDPAVFNVYQTGVAQQPEAAATAEIPGEGQVLEDLMDPVEAEKWRQYQDELMQGFPEAKIEEEVEVPPEEPGKGVNRRVFFVLRQRLEKTPKQKAISDPCDWMKSPLEQSIVEEAETLDSDTPVVLPLVTPQQINASRQIRWHLTGDLNAKVMSYPEFPGLEGDYLHALLVRITAGTAVSPKGYYRTKKYGDEEDGEGEEEEEEEEEEEKTKDDVVYVNKNFRYPNVASLTSRDLELWVHHAAHILKQGRVEWFSTAKPKGKTEDEEDVEEEEVEEEEEEEEERPSNKEIGPKLFTPLTEDKSLDPVGPTPWSARASSSVFTEFQVAHVRSNLWPGANAICTHKGKVENIYMGDGLKFNGRNYAPFVPEEPQAEYKEGPELDEIVDPSVEEEQAWLAKLQLDEIGDIEDKFVDNEEEGEGEEEDEDDEDD